MDTEHASASLSAEELVALGMRLFDPDCPDCQPYIRMVQTMLDAIPAMSVHGKAVHPDRVAAVEALVYGISPAAGASD